ncbi:helix-turn-helix transcriptional regulator [Calidifontibacter sp. DB0510]|uniref:Helix-turn-helix transcriptional regulator n=2 Tax=Metallococcus carri TaxID=1656884 RepID=A0A967EB17_9MICO|nr:helix-turn-helix transcriptional regulator [Metallococcus carri]NOP36118.1 helix-turn-helix transcriptional regulator [Calidifontibacter sp. DB2511S]
MGQMSLQSLTPKTYDDTVVAAAEWLAAALANAIARDATSPLGHDLYADHPELDSARPTSEIDLMSEVSHRMERIRRAARTVQIAAQESRPSDEIATEAALLAEICVEVQGEVVELLRAKEAAAKARLSHLQAAALRTALTPREAEIAGLIAVDQLTNSEIARHLHISLKTVKTHVGNILSKLGITQRSEIGYVLDPDGEERS